eukprot:gb/GEZN01002281.1/.p1 GENE.gb/GEZN01002281.1/~~gb/GEZN01002281.1/.p1  ORF type:complete len:671 (-),score=124.17 gb/GEZN01002281.1/:454-2466(-)
MRGNIMVTLALMLLLALSSAFYLPGVAPRDYADGEPVDMKVVNLDSVKNTLPYDFYSVPFCRPSTGVEVAAENLGEILTGHKIQSSAYELDMMVPEYCKFLCAKEYSPRQLNAFRQRIEEDYRINWLLDNMPAATKFFTESTVDGKTEYVAHYEKGFPMGFMGSEESFTDPEVAYLNNHVRLTVFYHQDPSAFEGSRVVGFEVEPFSIQHEVMGDWQPNDAAPPPLFTCPTDKLGEDFSDFDPQPVSGRDVQAAFVDKLLIFFTYDVLWEESPVKWASRWDLYLKMTDSQIHWFAIGNSIMIVLFLSGMVAMILVRTLHRDLLRYNKGRGGLWAEDNTQTEEERREQQQEETGWKLIHGDVFRPPAYGSVFAIMVGTGAQVLSMTFVTLTFALFGFLSPANRGGLLSAALLLFVLMGYVAGYVSTRTYKMFGLNNWKKNALMTATVFPGAVFVIFFILNLVIWGEKSSGAVPFPTLVSIVVLWLGISGPLCYLGSIWAFKKPQDPPPVTVNELPRKIVPTSHWYSSPNTAVLVAGVLPFGAVFIEIFFIMTSVWLHQFYYVFGILYLVFFILLVTCAEISVVMCYFQLCNEDYHWWWRSFFTSGSSAVYVFLYSILYFFTRLQIINVVSAVLFFSYMFIVSVLFCLLTGTIGYFACFYFVRKIYTSLKID